MNVGHSNEVCTSNDVGDSHPEIIHHICQLIGKRAVSPAQNRRTPLLDNRTFLRATAEILKLRNPLAPQCWLSEPTPHAGVDSTARAIVTHTPMNSLTPTIARRAVPIQIEPGTMTGKH
jgi:hypothetical protein